MSEERPVEREAMVRAGDLGASVQTSSPAPSPALALATEDDIAVEEGEPESLSAGLAPPAVARSEPPIPAPPDSVPSVARGRRMLRIPDDEVARPSAHPSAPPSTPASVEAPPSAPALPLPPNLSSPPSAPFEASGGPPIAASRIISINPPPPTAEPEIEHPRETEPDTTGPEIVVDEDEDGAAALAAPPSVELVPDSEPPPRLSEPGELVEVAPEDFVSIESPPLQRPQSLQRPAPAPLVSHAPKPKSIQHPPKSPRPPPLLLVPPGLASPLAPPPVNEASAASRRKVRPWWEDLFNDDFIRTMAKVTDAHIAREADFIEESLGLAKGAVILDLACGTGRHAIEMTKRGYQVVGFDLSLAMLAKAADEAQERDQKLNFVQGDMREMTFGETFDGVYTWNTSLGFFEEEKNSAVIANVHRALKPGGLLLLDVVNRDFVARQAPSLAWFEGDGCVCMDEMHVDWITSRMRVKRTMMLDDGRTKEIEYSIRIYALHELGKILHDQGFRVAEVSGRVSTPGSFMGADSPRILVVAEKR